MTLSVILTNNWMTVDNELERTSNAAVFA